jgi:hypothetical protein
VVGGEFFVMDYLMVFKPLTSRSLALRTGELHHCTMLVEKEASQPGAVQAGCSAYTSHRDLSVMAQRVEDEIQRAPYYRQVAHAAGNVTSQLHALLGQSKAWANSLATDRLLHAHVTLPASLWKGSGTLEGTVTCLIPVRKELVPAAALQGAMGFTTVAAYGREMAQLQRARSRGPAAAGGRLHRAPGAGRPAGQGAAGGKPAVPSLAPEHARQGDGQWLCSS